MHYFSKLVLLNSVEEISKRNIYDETVERLKNKNCCKKWSSNMNDKAYIEAYIKELSENSFKNKVKEIWSHLTNLKSSNSLSFKSKGSIHTLPSFLIIDNENNANSDVTENVLGSVKTSSCSCESKMEKNDGTSIKEKPLKLEENEKVKKVENLNREVEPTKRLQDLRKRHINVREANEEAFSYYEDKFNDFLSVKTKQDLNDVDIEESSINESLMKEENVKEEIVT